MINFLLGFFVTSTFSFAVCSYFLYLTCSRLLAEQEFDYEDLDFVEEWNQGNGDN